MNFYKKLRGKTTLSPLEVVNKMKEIAPIVNKNLTVEKYLQCEKGKRKMKGVRLNSFLETINNFNANPAETKINELNDQKWFEEFLENFNDKMKEFNIKSQNHLSKVTGVSQPRISFVLAGKEKATKEFIQAFKEFFEDDMNIQEETDIHYVYGEKPTNVKISYGEKVSDSEFERVKKQFAEKVKETGKSYAELSRVMDLDNTTIGKICRGDYKSKGIHVYKELKKFLNGECTMPIEKTTKSKVKVDEKTKKQWNRVVNQIAKYRKETEMSLLEIANKIGINVGTLSYILNDKYNISDTMLDRLKDGLKSIGIEEDTVDLEKCEETTFDDLDFVESEEIEEKLEEKVVEEPTYNESDLIKTQEFEEETCENVEEELDEKDKYIIALKTILENQDRIIANYETLIEVIRKYQEIA